MLINIILTTLVSSLLRSPAAEAGGGKWELLRQNMGVSAMHMQLMNNDRLVFFDRTDTGGSKLALAGKCTAGGDCTAHSAEYDTATGDLRPLTVLTDVWCSSGALMPDGTLTQTGGFGAGERVVRHFTPCDKCDWKEVGLGLLATRWYATNHILPDGRQIIIGGRRQFNYEFFPKKRNEALVELPFLVETNDKKEENNLYPFVFLLPDGNLFMFANNRAILLNYNQNKVVRAYPEIPGGDPRSYPSTGSAVLLPLNLNTNNAAIKPEVLICGGAPKGSFFQVFKEGKFIKALKTCARIQVSDPEPKWVVETMPMSRTMGDMLTLPNGHVLIINGAGSGAAGWGLAREPILAPVLYKPEQKIGLRFEVQNPTKTPRMYHSTAVLLRDGRVVVGGSNPNPRYNFKAEFPTELSMEAFQPDYMDVKFNDVRPKIVLPVSQAKFKYAQKLAVKFTIEGKVAAETVKVTMVFPSFATHSFSMNQRLLVLQMSEVKDLGKMTSQVDVTMPGSANLAPSGYYMMFVVHQDIPSHGVWVHIS